ncbi:MAG: aromatic-ring-hydroxylating dioxygenase [Actinomycetia bacterium]|nr:aromatic-ring-hydroxylating dioxygenase [Actinomycetes bacterium]
MSFSALDDAAYDDLVAFVAQLRSETGPADPELLDVAAAFLAREARLLDDGGYKAWLELFTDDCVYWIPSTAPIEDPRRAVSYLLDDHRRLEDRIALLDTGWAHAQIPPARTQRVITNVEAWPMTDGDLRVRASAVIWDWRREHLVAHPATLLYRLRPDAGGWRIAIRVIHRLDIDGPMGNVAYIL